MVVLIYECFLSSFGWKQNVREYPEMKSPHQRRNLFQFFSKNFQTFDHSAEYLSGDFLCNFISTICHWVVSWTFPGLISVGSDQEQILSLCAKTQERAQDVHVCARVGVTVIC